MQDINENMIGEEEMSIGRPSSAGSRKRKKPKFTDRKRDVYKFTTKTLIFFLVPIIYFVLNYFLRLELLNNMIDFIDEAIGYAMHGFSFSTNILRYKL
jgi:hypothetical protein